MKTKTRRLATVLVAMLLMALVSSAQAIIYTFAFIGNSGIDATGTIDITGGVAQSGSISVINVPLAAPPTHR